MWSQDSVTPELTKLVTPFSMVLAGPSGSGKSQFLFSLLNNLSECTYPPIKKVIFIYGVYQECFKDYPNIFFTPSIDFMRIRPEEPTLICIDDLMSSVRNSSTLEELFTRGRHSDLSVVLVLQNMFYAGSVLKTVRDNSTYIGLTQHIQDLSRLYTFAAQLEGKNSAYFKTSYTDAMKTPFNTLFIDLHPQSRLRGPPFFIKYRTGVHKHEGQTLYTDAEKYFEGQNKSEGT